MKKSDKTEKAVCEYCKKEIMSRKELRLMYEGEKNGMLVAEWPKNLPFYFLHKDCVNKPADKIGPFTLYYNGKSYTLDEALKEEQKGKNDKYKVGAAAFGFLALVGLGTGLTHLLWIGAIVGIGLAFLSDQAYQKGIRDMERLDRAYPK